MIHSLPFIFNFNSREIDYLNEVTINGIKTYYTKANKEVGRQRGALLVYPGGVVRWIADSWYSKEDLNNL